MFESWALTYIPYDTKKKKKKDFKGSDIILGMEEKLLSIHNFKKNHIIHLYVVRILGCKNIIIGQKNNWAT